MKIRNGFVSNSSSSSFVLIMKNGELTKECLLESFDVKETSPLFSFADKLSNWIIKNVTEMNIQDIYNNYVGSDKDKSTEQMIQEIIDDYRSIKKEDLEKIANNEYHYYYGFASDDSGDGLETFLCETGINMETDKIKIESGGSY